MIAPGNVTLILLAAGRSSRFGAEKLLHPIDGQSLLEMSASASMALPFAARLAVLKPGLPTPDNFARIDNDDPQAGLSRSLALGIAAVETKAALVMLADMPFVTAGHLSALMAAYDPVSAMIASAGETPQPPALFGARHFMQLLQMTGDKGARELLANAPTVPASPNILRDIDRPQDIMPGDLSSD